MQKHKKVSLRLVSTLLAVILMFSLVACGKTEAPAAETAPATKTETPAAAETAPAEDYGDFSFVYGSVGNDSEAGFRAVKKLMDYMTEKSDGHIQCQAFPNGALGNDREQLESVQMGQQTMVGSGLTQVSNFIPALATLDLPFAFSDASVIQAVIDDPEYFAYIRELAAEAGFYVGGISLMGFRTLTSNVKVTSMADMAGMKMRCMDAPTSVNLWTALGTNATPISFTELYTALQQGVVDAQENPISLINSSKFYEQQKYVINTNHQVMPIFWICNLDWYNSLPDEYKAYYDEGCKILTEYHASECAAEEEAFLQSWIEGGIEYIELTDEARAEMKEAALTVWPAIQEQYPEAYQKLQECLERVGAA